MTCSLHIWHVDPVSKVRKYIGPAKTDYDWLLFKREQGEKRDEYICNNVSPTGTVGPVFRPPTRATGKPRVVSSKAAEAMAQARREADRKMAESQKARAEKKAQADKRRAEDEKEMASIRQDAAGLVEQHKADEQRDLEAGINN